MVQNIMVHTNFLHMTTGGRHCDTDSANTESTNIRCNASSFVKHSFLAFTAEEQLQSAAERTLNISHTSTSFESHDSI